jgi:hypothetical protein
VAEPETEAYGAEAPKGLHEKLLRKCEGRLREMEIVR